MTTWIENPRGGRDRGPVALARAWLEVLVRPGRFFTNGIAEGDQAPGLVFAMTLVLGSELLRVAFVPSPYPLLVDAPLLSTAFWVLAATLFVAPLSLHLLSAIETVGLMLVVRDRAGISETVQVLAYATAPCLVAGYPDPRLRVLATAYAAALLVVGIAVVHDTSWRRALLASAVPGAVAFGFGFRGFAALGTVLSNWFII
jgi:hypothetical protein